VKKKFKNRQTSSKIMGTKVDWLKRTWREHCPWKTKNSELLKSNVWWTGALCLHVRYDNGPQSSWLRDQQTLSTGVSQFLSTKIPQGSVATSLRCGEMRN